MIFRKTILFFVLIGLLGLPTTSGFSNCRCAQKTISSSHNGMSHSCCKDESVSFHKQEIQTCFCKSSETDFSFFNTKVPGVEKTEIISKTGFTDSNYHLSFKSPFSAYHFERFSYLLPVSSSLAFKQSFLI